MVMPRKVELPKYEPSSVEAIRNLAVDSGSISAVLHQGSNTLTDNTKNWANGIHKNRLIKIVGAAASGAGQMAVIDNNTFNTITIKGKWSKAIGAGAGYVILEKDLAGILREVLKEVLNAGQNISRTHPLETHDPKVEVIEGKIDDIEAKLDDPDHGLDPIKASISYTEDTASGDTVGDGDWHDALDVDTRGMKSFSAVVKNNDAANSLNWRLRARPSNYESGVDEEIPECPGSETLGVGEKGLVELLKSYSRVKIQVQDTVGGSAADYVIDYLINR